ncbi:hypothetical protein ACFLYH_00085 [Candidatus Dependentiae bacterium]
MKGKKSVLVIFVFFIYGNLDAIKFPSFGKKSSTTTTTKSTVATTQTTKPSTFSKFKSKLPSSPWKKSTPTTSTIPTTQVTTAATTQTTKSSAFSKFKSKLPSFSWKKSTPTTSTTVADSVKSSVIGGESQVSVKPEVPVGGATGVAQVLEQAPKKTWSQRISSGTETIKSAASGIKEAVQAVSGIVQTGVEVAKIVAPRKFAQPAVQDKIIQTQVGMPQGQVSTSYSIPPMPQASMLPSATSPLPALVEEKPKIDQNLINQLVKTAQSLFAKSGNLQKLLNQNIAKSNELKKIAQSKQEESILINLQNMDSNIEVAKMLIIEGQNIVKSGYQDLGNNLVNKAQVSFASAEQKINHGETLIKNNQNVLVQAGSDLSELKKEKSALIEEKEIISEKVLTPVELTKEIDFSFKEIEKNLLDEIITDEQAKQIVQNLVSIFDIISSKIENTKKQIKFEELSQETKDKIDDSYEKLILFKAMKNSPLYDKKDMKFIKWLKKEIGGV